MYEAVEEIKFIYYLMESLRISVAVPIDVSIDNISETSMDENTSSGVRIRQIDTRYPFIH
jgi:hypothetical protein